MADLSPPIFKGPTIQELLDSIGYEAVWEQRTVQLPPKVCEPMPDDDPDWPRGKGPMPDDMDDFEPMVCAVHQEEWWPCAAFKAGRGMEEQPAVDTDVLVLRPRSADG